ncbi:abscisic acid ABA receptor [Thozetella sp. PMI_491]|nr:abscisic acid ABA receptor [Thozetella sp. PMI_491]
MESNYIPNDQPLLPRPADIKLLLSNTLQQILTEYPPQEKWELGQCFGAWQGPTSVAYLFLHVSTDLPGLIVNGEPAIHWARRYLEGERGPNGPQAADPEMCGLLSEKTGFLAIRACITKDKAHVQEFLATIPEALSGDYNADIPYGRSGVLYALRMIRHWVPDYATLLEEPTKQIMDSILSEGPNWIVWESRYLGPGHGDIGNITQLVLANPSIAKTVQPWLERLLDLQRPDGNWDKIEGVDGKDLVQWCHGAPGFVVSLVALRPYFPELHERIDHAIAKGAEVTWEKGLLRKGPNLCHGAFGNAMAFPPGERRDHFLALSLPEKIKEGQEADPTLFPAVDYGTFGLAQSYLPGLAWLLLKLDNENCPISCYNDL